MPSQKIDTKIEGVFELKKDKFSDDRGFFLSLFRATDKTFNECWSEKEIKQINLSQNKHEGTIRGLHYQDAPHSENKLVRCIKGRIWDVAVDLRRDSSTYLSWHGVELSSDNSNSLLIPEGCAHGFQVLEPDSQVLYLHSGDWVPESEKGISWEDPSLSIKWPLKASNLSLRDQKLPFIEDI